MGAGGEAGKPRIAILGGGIGALSTAFELTRDADWRTRIGDVTVYQLGWRLGGKCASSRDYRFRRIEEHGIHGFLGSYHNALPMMLACYEELGRIRAAGGGTPPAERPEQMAADDPAHWPRLDSFEDAFRRQDFGMLWELVGRTVSPWPQEFPDNTRRPSLTPETRPPFELCMAGVAETVMVMALLAVPLFGKALKAALQGKVERSAARWGKRLARHGAHPGIDRARRFWSFVKPAVHGISQIATGWRRQFILIDHLLTLVFGAYADRVHERGFDPLDDEDFTDFLRRHGAHADTVASPFNLNFINMTYQYPDGDTSLPASMAAGCYLRWALLATGFMGSFIWRFSAGTGEALIAPLYEVLKARGVRFEFFHKVTDLEPAADGKSVARVHMDVQATTRTGDAYQPLITVKGIPCWPDRPRYEQLNEGEALQAAHGTDAELAGFGFDLESYWTGWKAPKQRTLEAGRDFDQLVLAISIGALRHIAPKLIRADERWKGMIDHVPAYQTMAMQVWLTQDAAALGWDIPRKPGDAIFSTTWTNPQNGHAEFADLIAWEGWPKDRRPAGLWYFCGLMREDGPTPDFGDRTYPQRQKARVKYESIQTLQSAGGILIPRGSTSAQRPPGDYFGLDFGLMHDADADSRRGMSRFDGQFWRANIDPTERYVASPPGSTAHRLKAWDSGFANLALAGDWTYTGLNVGSVEGTVMSGRLASHALTARPPLGHIAGYPFDQPDAQSPFSRPAPDTGA